MSIARNVQLIYDGLFNPEYPPDKLEDRLAGVSMRVVNWPRCRRALSVLDSMTWHQLDNNWRYFMEEEKFPRNRPLDLRPEEVNQYINLLHQLKSDTEQGFRVLRAVHPEVTPTEHIVVVEAQDFKSLLSAVEHIEDVCKLAAVDGAITISSYHSGSLEIAIAAIGISFQALTLTIALAEKLRGSQIEKKIRQYKLLLERYKVEDVSKEKLLEDAIAEVRDEFWDEWKDPLDTLIVKEGKKSQSGEVREKINTAAKRIYENADNGSVTWRLPTAVIRGLPNGLEVEYYDDPELLLDKVLALPSPKGEKQTD